MVKPIAGTGKQAAAQRRELFKQAFLSNGHNQTAAAIEAGFNKKTAHQKGMELRRELEASGELAIAAQEAADAAKLHTHQTLQEVARIAYNDPRAFFREDDSFKPPSEWSDAMAATVASIEVKEVKAPEGGRAFIRKIKFWSKVDALDKAMRHAGLFEKDNRQLTANLAIQVNLLQPQSAPQEPVTISIEKARS
jgi:phage terminase small subunit